jgi:hypothetical protein
MPLHSRPFVLPLVTACLLFLPRARSADAQGVHPALLVGAGRSSWSGPYATRSTSDFNLAAALDWDVKPRVTLRAEFGLATRKAAMDQTGSIFDEEGTLGFTQPFGGLLARYALSRAQGWHSYVEAGAAAFTGATCDVDLEGGPGFLGGATYGCDDWVPDASSTGGRPITGVRSGVRPVFGLGATRRRLGATLRLEPMGTLAKTTTGNISATTVTLNLEYTFGRGR